MRSEVEVDKSHLIVDYSKIFVEEVCSEMRQSVVLIQSFWLDQYDNIQVQVNYSTGILISGNLILTAAHNIFNFQSQKFATKIELTFLNNVHKQKQIKKRSQKIVIYLNKQNYRCETQIRNKRQVYIKDIALISLQNHRQLKSRGFLNPIKPINSVNKKQRIYVYGFPDLKSYQSQKFKKMKQEQLTDQILAILKEDIGTVVNITNDEIYYRIQTVVGQSGSPLFTYNEKLKRFSLVGIHNSFKDKQMKGRGVFLNTKIYQMIERWAKQLNSQLPKYQHLQKQIKKKMQSSCQNLKNSFCQTIASFKNTFQQYPNEIRQQYQQYKRLFDSFFHQIDSYEMELNTILGDYNPQQQSWSEQDNVQMTDEVPQDQIILQLGNQSASKSLKLKELFQNSDPIRSFSFKNEEREQLQQLDCPNHPYQQTFYRYYKDSSGQYEKICNRCVKYDEEQKKDILCIKHNKIIEFALADYEDNIELQENSQAYLCQFCPKHNINPNLHFARIDQAHHQPIKYIKLNFHFYKNTKKYPNQNIFRQFLLCEKCQNKDKVQINVDELQKRIDHHNLEHQLRIVSYLRSIQGFIRLKQFQKVKNYYMVQSKPIFNFFEAIEDSILCRSKRIYQILSDYRSSSEQIQKIVEKLAYLQKYKLQQKTSQQIMKLVEFYKDFIEQESYHQLIKISEGLRRLKQSIQYQFDHKSGIQRVEESIKAKYYRIVNKVKHNQLLIKPCLLNQVLPAYYPNIFQIFVVKEFEDQEETALRKEQLAYYEKQWEKYYSGNKFNKQFRQEWNLLSKQTNFYKKEQRRIQAQFKFDNRKNQKKAIILQKINNFPNLTKLTVIYDHFKCNYQDFDYQIQSMDLVEIMLSKEKLKMIQIYGIKINHMMWLIEELYLHRSQYPSIINMLHQKEITLHLKVSVEINSIDQLVAFAFFVSIFPKIINFTLSFTSSQVNFDTNEDEESFFYHQSLIREQMLQRLQAIQKKNKQTHKQLSPFLSFKDRQKNAKRLFIQLSHKLQRINIQTKKESFFNLMQEIEEDEYKHIKNINTLIFRNMTITKNMRKGISYLLSNNFTTYLTFKNCIHEQHIISSIRKSIIAIEFTNCSMSTSELNQMLKSKSQMIQLKLESVSLEDWKMQDKIEKQIDAKFDYLRRLVNLHLINCIWVTDQAMEKLPKKCVKNIEILRLASCPHLTSRVIYNTVYNFQRLNTLDISISLLALQTKSLAHLELGSTNVTEPVLLQIDRKWPTISYLNIYGCKHISDAIFETSFKHISKLDFQRRKISFSKLKQLRLMGVQILSPYELGIDLYYI